MIRKLFTSIATLFLAGVLTLGWVAVVQMLGVPPWLDRTLSFLGGVFFGFLAIDAVSDYWRRS